jgi:transcriptional regulator with PAS, ATPase and Fis domain
MSPAVQTKLLRVLQEREFERVGDSHTIKVDVRVIAATNSDLSKLAAEGAFREDLYYRLNVIPIKLPPLRERRGDIPLLVRHFLQRFGRDLTPPRTDMTVSQQAMRSLMSYQWPGNVRQLENVMERAIALSPGRSQIELTDLPPEIQDIAESVSHGPDLSIPDEGIDFNAYVNGVERALIQRSLDKAGGNKRLAAKLLNVKRTTLIEKLKRLDKRH